MSDNCQNLPQNHLTMGSSLVNYPWYLSEAYKSCCRKRACINKYGARFLANIYKGHIAGRGRFFPGDNTMWHQSAGIISVGCCSPVIQDWMIPFAAYITAYTSNAFQWAGQPPKIAPSHRDLEPHLIHGSLGTHKSAPKWHLDRLSHYSTSVWPTHRQRDRHTDRQTTLCATSVAIDRICDAAYNIQHLICSVP